MFDVAMVFMTQLVPIIPLFVAIILTFNIIASLLWDK